MGNVYQFLINKILKFCSEKIKIPVFI